MVLDEAMLFIFHKAFKGNLSMRQDMQNNFMRLTNQQARFKPKWMDTNHLRDELVKGKVKISVWGACLRSVWLDMFVLQAQGPN